MNLENDVEASLEAYRQLEKLAITIRPLQEAAEGAAPHLSNYIANSTSAARASIQQFLSTDLENTLKKIGWPRADASVTPGLHQEWTSVISRLLDLQLPELEAIHNNNRAMTSKSEPAVLLPFQIMVQPLALRFQYHFSGDRLTNRLDKPEYFLSHVLDLLNDHNSFFQGNVQPLLIAHFRETDLAFTPAYMDATSALITSLLPLLRRKLASILHDVVKKPSLFSNLIHEVMSFDTTLADDWSYAPLSPSTPFRGLAHYILSELEYFPAWFTVERDFALSRYEAIISDRSTGLLDYDSMDAHATKPTKAAIRVNDLLETITDRYRPLSSFSQKVKFLIDIQIAIFDRFHGRLHESLEAFLTRTSTVARTMHGISREDAAELSGTKGLDRLCRVFGSARYLEKAMSDWSEDIFFLDLWEELQYRSQHPESIRGDLSMQAIASKTSSTINESGSGEEAGELQGALFDETTASYHRLRVRSEQVITDTITYDIRSALRPYGRVNTWASMSSSGSENSLTAELDVSVRLLDEYLGFLAKAMGKAPVRKIVRQLGGSMQTLLWDNVLAVHTFSTAGAAQLSADVKGLWRVMDRHVGNGQGRAGMSRLAEGLVLLGLPVRGEIPVDMNISDDGDGQIARKLGLWEVEKRVFADNESAREVLEELGLDVLSEHDAREVLKRRVEISS